jgi:hypothetical protein
MYEHKPCHFMREGGCSIYDDRPKNPCKIFLCSWLIDDGSKFPDWLHPKLSNIIIRERFWGENKEKIFLEIVECGVKIDSEILVWLMHYHYRTNVPMVIRVNSKWNYFGPPEFCGNIDDIFFKNI